MPDDMTAVRGLREPTHVAEIDFDLIDQNPYRDLINNPLRPEQVERLALSIQSTEFWDNVMVRPHPTRPGRYQLAYGHARLEAARIAGRHRATFIVRSFDEAAMIRVMADENVSQFGKDSFKIYKEATVAAATWIMGETLAGRGANFSTPLDDAAERNISTLETTIADGGCPGRRLIWSFYRGTLDANNIELALSAYHQTGELAAWHREHNSNRVKMPPSDPAVNPEAIRHFDKPSHVRSFIQAVLETNTPYDEQKRIADKIIKELGPEPKRSRTGRTSFQAERKREDRFNAGNIRNRVVTEALNRTRAPRRKAELERIKQMSSLERALTDLGAGLSRTVSGCKHIAGLIEVMGGITETDLTPAAREQLRKAAKSVAEIESYFRQRPFRKFLRLASGR